MASQAMADLCLHDARQLLPARLYSRIEPDELTTALPRDAREILPQPALAVKL